MLALLILWSIWLWLAGVVVVVLAVVEAVLVVLNKPRHFLLLLVLH
jgi:hypothetical protein